MEEWRTCTVNELYEVSNIGNIRNKKTRRILKQAFNGYYYFVNLSKNGVYKATLIHRLVALAFIPNLENKPCVDHIEKPTSNNTVSNLRWATVEENRRNSCISKNNTSSYKGVSLDKKTGKYRAQIRINGKGTYLGSFTTALEASEAYKEASKEHYGEYARS